MSELTRLNLMWQERILDLFPDTPLVFGEGPLHPRLMLIGEAPGEQEVTQGRPFAGKAGKNLDEFLQGTGLVREEIYISNTVKLRPFKIGPTGRKSNRPPSKEEIKAFLPWLQEEIELVSPGMIATLGNTPLRALLGNDRTVGQIHGQVTVWGTHPVFPLYHPASIIYNPSLKAVYWADVNTLSRLLKEEVAK